MTDFAGDVDIWQEVHFYFDYAIAGAVFAAATFDVKAKASGGVAAQFGIWQAGKQLPNRAKQTGVGCRVGARRTANWRLVNNNSFV